MRWQFHASTIGLNCTVELCVTSESIFIAEFCVTSELVFTDEFCIGSKPAFANDFSAIDFHTKIDLNVCNDLCILHEQMYLMCNRRSTLLFKLIILVVLEQERVFMNVYI